MSNTQGLHKLTGNVRFGSGFTVNNGVASVNFNNNGASENATYSAQTLDKILYNIANEIGIAGMMTKWTPPTIVPDNQITAQALSISGNGDVIAATLSSGNPSVLVYRKDSMGIYTQVPLTHSDSNTSGCWVSDNGNRIVIARDSGTQCYNYEWDAGTGSYVGSGFVSGINSGGRRSVSANGLRLITRGTSILESMTWNGSAWVSDASPSVEAPGGTNQTVRLNGDGTKLIVTHSAAPFMTSYTWNVANNRFQPDNAVYPTPTSAFTENIPVISADGSKVIGGGGRSYKWVSAANRYELTNAFDINPSFLAYSVSISADGNVFYNSNAFNFGSWRWSETNNRYEKMAAPVLAPYTISSDYRSHMSADGQLVLLIVDAPFYYRLLKHNSTTDRYEPYTVVNKAAFFD